MKKIFALVLFFLTGVVLGTLMISVWFGDHFDKMIFRTSDSTSTKDSAHQTDEILYEIRKLLDNLNNTRYIHLEERESTPVSASMINNSTNVVRGTRLAEQLYSQTRIFCWILTCASYLEIRAKVVRDTWAKRCNKAIFVSDEDNATFPAIGFGVGTGREHLTAKTMRAFDYVYEHHRNDADWFLKADDDTFVIVENLRYLLGEHSPTEPIYFGHPFKVLVKQGYFSGGAGYVISREALVRFGARNRKLCADDGGSEDVEFGKCMQNLNVSLGDSRDKLGRSRFHCFTIEESLSRNYMPWYYAYSKYNPDEISVSEYPISFHYVTPEAMRFLEYYVYHLKVYGQDHGVETGNMSAVYKHGADVSKR